MRAKARRRGARATGARVRPPNVLSFPRSAWERGVFDALRRLPGATRSVAASAFPRGAWERAHVGGTGAAHWAAAGDWPPGPPPALASGPAPAPPPLAPGPSEATGPAAAPPALQKLTLYASGALVVLIVLVIILLSAQPRRGILAHVAAAHRAVQVLDIRRFVQAPIQAALAAAKHPVLTRVPDLAEKWGLDPKWDVAQIAEAEGSLILVGRFQAAQLQAAFRRVLLEREAHLARLGVAEGRLDVDEDEVAGRRYAYCASPAADLAFASIGSTVACFGSRLGVQRSLKASAGYAGILDAPHVEAAYSPLLARRAFLYRIERPGGKTLTQALREVLGPAAGDVHAAFIALAASGKAIEVTLRFAVDSEEGLRTLEAQLATEAATRALRELLGTEAPPRVARARSRVLVVEATVDAARLQEIAGQDPRIQGRNLILALLAN